MADDATPARQRAANLARQEEVARLALDVAPGSDWADALAACGLLVPKKMARAAGIRALAAAGYDGEKLNDADQAGLKKTLEKVSSAADELAAARGTARKLPAAGSDEFLLDFCEAAQELALAAQRAESEGMTAALSVMSSKRRLELEEEGRASGRIPREKEKEKNKFDAVETRSELTSVYKYANGRVAMPGYELPSSEALRETYSASLGAHPSLPAYGRGINWATERAPAPIERDRKSGRVIGTLHGGKGADPTVNDYVAEFMRALTAAGLGWSSRLGPEGPLPDIRVDAECDEYGQSPEGAILYTGCMPPVLQIFKDKFRAVVLEAPECAPEQAEELARALWELLSAEVSGRSCSLTKAMLELLARPNVWQLPVERLRGGGVSSRNDRKMAARTAARPRWRGAERSSSPESQPGGHCFSWADTGECAAGSSCRWAHTHTPRDPHDRAGSTPHPARKAKRVKWGAKRERRERGRSGSGNETDGTGGETEGEA